jgi:hypothetical protein
MGETRLFFSIHSEIRKGAYMELTFIPNKDDYSALFRYVLNTAVNRRQRFMKALFAPAMFFVGYVVSRFLSNDVLPISYYVGEALLAGAITTGWIWYRYNNFHRAAAKLHIKESPDFGKLQKFTISPKGIDITIAETNMFRVRSQSSV